MNRAGSSLLLLLLLACGSLCAQSVLLVTEPDADGAAAEAGARAALEALKLPANDFMTVKTLEGTWPSSVRVVLVSGSRERTEAVLSAGKKRAVPVVDLGSHGLGDASEFPAADEGADGAWWLCQPFAHHDVLVLQGNDKRDRDVAQAFVTKARAIDPLKRIEGPESIPSGGALARRVEKAVQAGITAVFVAAGPRSAKNVCAVAHSSRPQLVALCGTHAFAPDDPEHQLVEGSLILRPAPPTHHALKALPALAGWTKRAGRGSAIGLAAFDAVVEQLAPAGLVLPETASAQRFGTRLATRGSDGRRLLLMPWWQESAEFKPMYAFDENRPQPVMENYDPQRGFGSFSRWSTLRFVPKEKTQLAHFHYGKGERRTIEMDLEKLKLSTQGRLPVIDHLVREKLMARVLSVTGEKYGLEMDGTPKPGVSFAISLASRLPAKLPTKRVWPSEVAGDDPEAGGRAYGSYCEIYSTFIRRTIFEQRELLERPVDAADLCTLTGILEEPGPYVTGTRRDVLYRLVEGFAGSMGLTAAHEIGHLAGLGHDEDDPCGIMNVKEGGGISHHDGHFTPNNEAALEKTLGRVPNATPRK
jgi:hypothetical protein